MMPTKMAKQERALKRRKKVVEEFLREELRDVLRNPDSFRWRRLTPLCMKADWVAVPGRRRGLLAELLLDQQVVSAENRDRFLLRVRKHRRFLRLITCLRRPWRRTTRWVNVSESILRAYARSPVPAACLAAWFDSQYIGVRVDAVMNLQPRFVLLAHGRMTHPAEQAGYEAWVKWFAEAECRRSGGLRGAPPLVGAEALVEGMPGGLGGRTRRRRRPGPS